VVVAVVVAVVVLAAAIGTTLVMRQLREAAARPTTSTAPGPTTPTGPVQLCGQAACVKLASVSMPQFKETVELLADGRGQFAQLRISSERGVVSFSSQVRNVTGHSITCEEGKTSACLLQGKDDAEVIGEVYVDNGGVWTQSAVPFGSDAGYLALRDVTGDGTPDVVMTQRRCGDNPPASCTKVAAAVFQLTGDEVGCTVTYATPQQLPGWPDVAPAPGKLGQCAS
jgi:hypothetical protein